MTKFDSNPMPPPKPTVPHPTSTVVGDESLWQAYSESSKKIMNHKRKGRKTKASRRTFGESLAPVSEFQQPPIEELPAASANAGLVFELSFSDWELPFDVLGFGRLGAGLG